MRRVDVYRVACDEAAAELAEIVEKVEQLRKRQDRIGKALEALKSLVESDDQVNASEQQPELAAR
jgi:hypothetical protein